MVLPKRLENCHHVEQSDAVPLLRFFFGIHTVMHTEVLYQIMKGLTRLVIAVGLVLSFVCWSLSIFSADALLPIMLVLGIIGTYS